MVVYKLIHHNYFLVTALVAFGILSQSERPIRLQKMPYDSTFVRSIAGNYRIDSDRVISMGPMDEAEGWLSFFDSKTRRGGILYALTDSTLFTGPTFGVDSPMTIQAKIIRGNKNEISGLLWQEPGQPSQDAIRLKDFRQEEISFNNGSVRLAGNLTLPNTTGPHPAVILIHGAGTIVPTRDFGYWSVYFAGHGIAVLAFDKRGGGASGGNAFTASYKDLADDVIAGLTMLQNRPDIDPGRIGLYGTSNGGYIAPLVAVRSNHRVAFITVRSGSALNVGNNIDYEVGNDLRSEGFAETDIKRAVSIRHQVTDFVIGHPTITQANWDSLVLEVNKVSGERWFPWARVAWVPRISPSDSFGSGFIAKLRAEWQYDPIPYWRQVRCPVYVMLGEHDRSVSSSETASLLRKTLAANSQATIRIFPNGNHGLLESKTGFNSEMKSLAYYVPDFQSSLISWIQRVTRQK